MEAEKPRFYTTKDKKISAVMLAFGVKITAFRDPSGTVNFTCDELIGLSTVDKIYANEPVGSLDILKALKQIETILWQTVRES